MQLTPPPLQFLNGFGRITKLISADDWGAAAPFCPPGYATDPSIPHREGLEAVREALDRRENPGVATDTLVGLASLVLENNYFEFIDRLYRQKLRTAIGTKFAPAYANLFITR